MWTDMSEIVRPTRDGIHGREYINTCIELSRRPKGLQFNKDNMLEGDLPPILEIPLPIIFQPANFGMLSKNVLLSMVKAAAKLGTFIFVKPKEIQGKIKLYLKNIIPLMNKNNCSDHVDLISACKMVELEYDKDIGNVISKIRQIKKDICICVGIVLKPDAPDIAAELANTGVDTIHYYADSNGREVDTENSLFIKEALRNIHTRLIEESTRLTVNIVVSGGIAMAEHVNKAIICGADGVVLDNPLLIAMECRMCKRCQNGLSCPVKLEEIDSDYGCRRIINLMGAWRNQMLEMLGAMGLREIRRLRGEVGRSMWFEDLEKESFAPIFGERLVQRDGMMSTSKKNSAHGA
jgi:hypothetical protein